MSTESVDTFLSIRGYPSCPWYRQALCVAQEFIDKQQQQPTSETDASQLSSSSSSLPSVQIEAHSMTPIQYSQHLSALNQYIDLKEHNSCPVILEGSCNRDNQQQQNNKDNQDDKSVLAHCQVTSIVGGYTDFARLLYERYGFKPERCSIDNIRKGSDRC